MARLLGLLLAVALLPVLPLAVASADAPPGPYLNGFETNTAGWFNNGGGPIVRVSDFYSNRYADGIDSASGGYHDRRSERRKFGREITS